MSKFTSEDLKKMALEVQSICPHLPHNQILLDLENTCSVATTINRIFDGTFMHGVKSANHVLWKTPIDPSVPVRKPASKVFEGIEITDSPLEPESRKCKSIYPSLSISDSDNSPQKRPIAREKARVLNISDSSSPTRPTMPIAAKRRLSLDISSDEGLSSPSKELDYNSSKFLQGEVADFGASEPSFDCSKVAVNKALVSKKKKKYCFGIISSSSDGFSDVDQRKPIVKKARRAKKTEEEKAVNKVDKEERKRLKEKERVWMCLKQQQVAKEIKSAAKKAAKEMNAASKQQDKAAKIKELTDKQTLKKANKHRTKTESMQEMIVQFDSVFREGSHRQAPTIVEGEA